MSLKAEMARIFARIARADQGMARNLEKPVRGAGALAPDQFTKKVRVLPWNVDGFYGVTVNGSYIGKGHIIMIPGWGYTMEPCKRHREIAQNLALKKQVKVSVLPYPLAPEFNALASHQFLIRAYQYLLSRYPEDEFYLFGDSSGGGLALSFIQELSGSGILPLPKKTAVVSPWLDISLDNPKIKIAKKTDPILPVEALKAAGERYRGPLDAGHPFVSPLHGNWNYLGPILMFSGTNEILTPDCELLAEKAAAFEGTTLVYKKGANMIHDWILIPCRERDATLELISTFFLDATVQF